MEMQKCKKEIKQAVKITLLIFIFNHSVCGQSNLIGEFISTKGTIRKTLNLRQGNMFYDTVLDALSHGKHIGKGYYLIKEDSLILFYDGSFVIDSLSENTIMRKSDSIYREFGGAFKIDKDVASIKLEVVNKEGQPIKGVSIGFMNDDRVVFGKITDIDGEVETYTQGELIDTISIFGLGYKSLHISMNCLWGFDSPR